MEKLVLVQKAISKVFGDFVAKAVSDSVDVLKDAIKDADLDRKSYNQNLQTRLYQLIVDALNKFTYNKYEKQDKLYDAAESIIKGYIRTQDNVDAVKLGLKMLVSDVNRDTCQEFSETLCGEICSDDNSDLYKEIDMLWKRQESEYFRGEFAKVDQNDREILEQLNDLKEVLEFIKINMSRQDDKSGHNRIPIVNRAGEYADKWEKNVFLNDFNKRDKNAGVNIKLKELYLEEHLPHYVWKTNDEPLDDLKELLCEYTVDNDGKKMLMILGQAGIGKSTLVTWTMANLVEEKENILIYQFASDLRSVNWQDDNILDEIFATIDLGYNMLEGKTLILDGFDEISVRENRERILHKLNQELEEKNYLRKFSLVLTCRENYVDKVELKGIEYITLQVWDEKQIRSFCENYEKVIIRKDSESIFNRNSEVKISKIIEKKDIMGIPLILYMVLALNVDIERSSSTVDIYDQIFSLKKGGIYDRGYDAEHRINAAKIKKHIHHISQRIAFWMFENNADKATILQEKFEEICENEVRGSGEKGEDIKGDTLIGNFFKLNHCEGKETDELQFVHRSIYEYFVVVYFYESIYKLKSKEEVAGKLGELLKDGHLSKQILEFIKYKFDDIKGIDLPDAVKEIFNIMLRDGMTYHIGKTTLNVMDREINIFSNMLETMHLWNPDLGELDVGIVTYLQYNNQNQLNLKGSKLENKHLYGVNLTRADLRGTDLKRVDLRRANLENANLENANLYCADLRKTYLKSACLCQTNLCRANLSKGNLSGAKLLKANLMETDLIGADLSNSELKEADLSKAYLTRANLEEAELIRVKLVGAWLMGANLRGADLTEANLVGANLAETLFDELQVSLLHKDYDLSKSKVLIADTKEIMNYRLYCTRK